MERTLEQYDAVLARCRALFAAKARDYGTAWRILRPSSLTDQMFIKAMRIRSIQEAGTQKVDEPVEDAFMALVNYGLMALIQLRLPADAPLELSEAEALRLYDEEARRTRELMIAKNHDYGEAWRQMRVSAITDMILMKLLRLRQIEAQSGKTIASEGPEGNYRDIVNYAIFALILLEEQRHN